MRVLTRSHVKWALIVIAFALTGIALAVLAGRQATTAERLDASRERVAVLELQNADAQARSQALSDQVEDLGETPVVTVPEVIPGETGATGATGSRGLTGATGAAGEDGRSIIGPRGPAGPVGADGETVIGPVGPIGKQGEAGKDGQSITGPAGPKGEKGDTGDRGPVGADGESIVGPVGPAGADSTVPGPPGPAGPTGPQGIPGVANVTTSPACADLMPNMAISLDYDANSQTVTLICA